MNHYQRYGLKVKELVDEPVSAREAYHAHRWRILFCIGLCGLAILCIWAALA
jgi:hypothetical protein